MQTFIHVSDISSLTNIIKFEIVLIYFLYFLSNVVFFWIFKSWKLMLQMLPLVGWHYWRDFWFHTGRFMFSLEVKGIWCFPILTREPHSVVWRIVSSQSTWKISESMLYCWEKSGKMLSWKKFLVSSDSTHEHALFLRIYVIKVMVGIRTVFFDEKSETDSDLVGHSERDTKWSC